MATLEYLRSQGWHITTEGLSLLGENEAYPDPRIIRKALDVDIRDIGAPVITALISRNSFGPAVLQIVKIRNIAAPRNKPNSQSAPRMLKLVLTDGHANCQGIEIKQLPLLSLDKTPPGTKLYIDGAQVVSGYMLLEPACCRILGGHVSILVEKWELSKLMPSHVRVTEDGPPAWVNFGKKIISNVGGSQSFKSLENKNKESSKENVEFQVQRQDAIAEAAQGGAVKKIFGGGIKPMMMQPNYTNEVNTSQPPAQRPAAAAAPRPLKSKGKEKAEAEKIEKPSQKVSLFDFLEDKLNLTETHSASNEEAAAPAKNRADYSENAAQVGARNKVPESSSFAPRAAAPKENKFKAKSYSGSQQDENKCKHAPDSRYQSDKPPRFQKQKPPQPPARLATASTEARTKPNTNNFVDKLAHEINNISLYNNKYESERLNRQSSRAAESSSSSAQWRWRLGDRCMAKYWEDNKFYNAVVTGITDRTCMVEFIEYGNFEEVLHCDCIPITNDKQDRQHVSPPSSTDNQQFAGNLEFRRGKNRSYVRTPNRGVQGQNYNYES